MTLLRRRRVPLRTQVEQSDCGGACLAMTLAYHGCHVPLEEIRARTGTGREGTSAATLVETAAAFGLVARAFRGPPDTLPDLPTGTIVLWRRNHYVVFERASRTAVDIVDPTVGRRRVPMAEALAAFGGVVVICEPGPEFHRRRPRRSWYLRHAVRVALPWRRFVSIVVASALLRGAALSLPLATSFVVDEAIPRSSDGLLLGAAYLLASVVVANAIASMLRGRLLLRLRVAGDGELTRSFLAHLTALPLRFFLTRSPGDLMLRLRSIFLIRELLATATLSAVLDGLFAMSFLVLLFLASAELALAAAGLAVVEVVALLAVRRRIEFQSTEMLAHQIRTQVASFQMFSGIVMLKALRAEPIALERYYERFADELAAFTRRTRTTTTVEALMTSLRMAIPVVVLLLAARRVMAGDLSLGTALAASALAAGFAEPFAAFATAFVGLQELPAHLERVEDVFTVPAPEPAADEVAPTRFVEARGLSFAYSPHAPRTLSDVSLRIPAGTLTVLTGPSGCGKTTLAGVLAGLLDPTSGEVRYDDVVVNGTHATARAGSVGVVAQGSLLFDGSIRDNVTLGNPAATDEEIYAHLDTTGIGDFVRELPLGLDTVVGEGGTSLSGGQAQRVTVARALAARPALLVLDEATNQLDVDTEARLVDNVRRLARTVILVTHRPQLLRHADLVVRMDAGRVVEVTTPTPPDLGEGEAPDAVAPSEHSG